jgi:threonine synthase
VLPVCYGDALAGVAAGFRDLVSTGKIAHIPRLVAGEVHGSLATVLEKGLDRIEEQEPSFETVALSIGTTRSTYQAVKALRETGGRAVCVSNARARDHSAQWSSGGHRDCKRLEGPRHFSQAS